MEAWYESKLTRPWMRKYFSFQGRLNRKPYILRGVILYVLYKLVCVFTAVLVALVLEVLGIQKEHNDMYIVTTSYVVGFIPNIIYLVGSLSLIARRLHDLNQTARWFIKNNLIAIALIYGALLVCWVLYSLQAIFIVDFGMVLLIGITLVIFRLYLLFIMICLLLKKGTAGENRFGVPLV